jgi:hypothetical protein
MLLETQGHIARPDSLTTRRPRHSSFHADAAGSSKYR